MKADDQLHWISQGGQHLMVTGQTRKDHVVGGGWLKYSMPGRATGVRVVQSITAGWWVLYDNEDLMAVVVSDVGPFSCVADAKAYAEATYTLERSVL